MQSVQVIPSGTGAVQSVLTAQGIPDPLHHPLHVSVVAAAIIVPCLSPPLPAATKQLICSSSGPFLRGGALLALLPSSGGSGAATPQLFHQP